MNRDLLETLRKYYGYSQSFVSTRLGCKSYSGYQHKLNNDNWTIHDLRVLACLYDIQPSDLLDGDTNTILLKIQLRQEEYALMRKALERI